MGRITRLLVLSLVLLSGLVAVAAAQSDELLDGKIRTGDTVRIGAGETVDGDLYLFGGQIRVDGVVRGDVVAFGGQVRVDGTIEGDLMVGAGTVDIDGSVHGDVRAGTGQLGLSGEIGEDLLAGSGLLTTDGDVGGDVIFGAGQVDLDGTIGGDVLGGAGQYSSSATIAGTEDVTVDEDVEIERPNPVLVALSRFGSLLLIGLGLLYWARPWIERRVRALEASPGPAALWGLVFVAALLVVPLLATLVGVLAALIVGWLGLGLLAGVIVVTLVTVWIATFVIGFVVIAVVAPLVVSLWLASLTLPDDTPGYLALAGGLVVVVVATSVPAVGWLFGLAVTVLGSGAVIRSLRARRDAGTAETLADATS